MPQAGCCSLPRCGEVPKPFCIDDCARRKTRMVRFPIDRYTTQISLTFKREKYFGTNLPALCTFQLSRLSGCVVALHRTKYSSFPANQCLRRRRLGSPFSCLSSALVTFQSNRVFSFLVIRQMRYICEAILRRKWFVEGEHFGDLIEGQKILLEHCGGR